MSKARKVLYDNGINLATAHTIHHLLKARSVEIAACVTIIHKIHHRQILQTFFVGNIPLDQFFLVFDAVALVFSILTQITVRP